MTAKNRATSLKRFWQGVESLPTLAAIESEWRDLLRDDFGAIQPFLSPRQELASSYPRFPTCGLPYRVVDHGGGDFVGVCDESHETIPLSATQLIVYELNQQRIAKQVATALGLSAAEPFGLPNMRLFNLGILRSSAGSRGTFLSLSCTKADLAVNAAALISQQVHPFLLLTPTRRFVTVELELRLRSLNSAILPLAEALVVGANGEWRIVAAAIQEAMTNRRTESVDELLSNRVRDVLSAMRQLKAFSADSRRPTAVIAARALGPTADANSLKSVIAELVTRKFCKTCRGRSGGCWLTEAGKLRAERLGNS